VSYKNKNKLFSDTHTLFFFQNIFFLPGLSLKSLIILNFSFSNRMSEQVIKVTTSIDITFSDLESRLPRPEAKAIWDFLMTISKKKHIRYTVEARQYCFIKEVLIDACVIEAPINSSDSDSTYHSSSE
jgi:hypothetical protein